MSEQGSAAAPATAADVMRPPLTTVEQQGALFILRFRGLQDVDGFDELPGAAGAAAELAQDAPGFVLGIGALAGAAEPGVSPVGVLLRGGLAPAPVRGADVLLAVADGKDVNSARIYELMTTRPTVIKTTTNVRAAAKLMTSGHFRHRGLIEAMRGTLEPEQTPGGELSMTMSLPAALRPART